MQGQTYQCPGCFFNLPADCIDFKTRRAVCPACGNLVTLTRKSINTSETVVHDVENAVRFFCDGNFDSARRYAESVLSVAVDHAAALYILAYYSAFVAENKNRTHLEKFFNETLLDLDCDEEELEALKKIMLKTLGHLADYEKIILKKLSATQRPKDLAEFVESFCPYLIGKRINIDWFDSEMVDLYYFITLSADIPKTWYALFVSISKNPDSPEAGNTFYLRTKTERFYREYVLGIEKVFSGIKTDVLKAKFNGAFCKKKEELINKMKSNGGQI